MPQNQLPLFPNLPKDEDTILIKLGIDPAKYQSWSDPKQGRPGLSEITLPGFFPKLAVGIELPSGTKLGIERRNLQDIYEIDYHILLNGKPIAFIDNEQRTNDFPFDNLTTPINIPLHSFRSNIEGWQQHPYSQKTKYYLTYPECSFHLLRHSKMNKAICCWAKTFIHLSPQLQQTWFGSILVWKVPRHETCEGKIHEETIENWVLAKLLQVNILSIEIKGGR